MQIQIKKAKISEIRPNQDNPRLIKKAELESLVKSLKEFPEMLEIREIVVDETMTVLGGNMRLRSLIEAGAKSCIVKIVSGLTDEQKWEFAIKDNGSWGEWNYDELSALDDLPLADWGVDLPKEWSSEPDTDPQIPPEDNYAEQYGVIVICESESHQAEVYDFLRENGYHCKVVNT